MKKVNFHALNDLPVSDELKSRLLSIPTEHKSQPAILLFFKNRAVITAASVMLAAALGIAVFFSIGNKSTVPIAPSPTVYSTQADESTPTVSESASQGDSTSAAAPETVISTQLTTDAEGEVIVITIIETITQTTQDQGPAEPSEKETESPARAPSVKPTSSPQEHADSSTQAPATESPTQKSPLHWGDEPTDPPDGPTRAPEPPQPTEEPFPPIPWEYTEYLCGVIPYGSFNDTDRKYVYCGIYDSSGNLVGEDPLFSEKRKIYTNTPYVRYYPSSLGINIPQGEYQYIFYDAYGVEIFWGKAAYIGMGMWYVIE